VSASPVGSRQTNFGTMKIVLSGVGSITIKTENGSRNIRRNIEIKILISAKSMRRNTEKLIKAVEKNIRKNIIEATKSNMEDAHVSYS